MSNGYLRVSKFSELQHYSERPANPWIKFYVRLLDDEEMNQLPVPTRLLWDRLLLLAQRFGNVIPNDPERVANLTCIPTRDVREGIDQLLAGRWLSLTKTPRRASKRASKPASPDTDTERDKEPGVLEGPLEEHAEVRSILQRQFPDLKLVKEMPA